MADRRMFAKTIIDSDAFLDMPLSSQSLYFHLSMRADDDGFLNNPKKVQRMIGASDDDLKLLINTSIAAECAVCLKDAKEQKKCALRKALENIAPTAELHKDGLCTYVDVAAAWDLGKYI